MVGEVCSLVGVAVVLAGVSLGTTVPLEGVGRDAATLGSVTLAFALSVPFENSDSRKCSGTPAVVGPIVELEARGGTEAETEAGVTAEKGG